MKRFRLGTLLWLIVVIALVVALVVQDRRATQREALLRQMNQRYETEVLRLTIEQTRLTKMWQEATAGKGSQ